MKNGGQPLSQVCISVIEAIHYGQKYEVNKKIHMKFELKSLIFELKSLIIRKIYEFYQNLRWWSAAILNLCQHSRITYWDHRYY